MSEKRISFPNSVPKEYRMHLGLIISRYFKKQYSLDEVVQRLQNRNVPATNAYAKERCLFIELSLPSGRTLFLRCWEDEE